MDPDGRFQSPAYRTRDRVLLGINSLDPRRLISGINSLFSIDFKKDDTGDSTTYQVGSRELPNIGIGFINGINNSREAALNNTIRLHQYTPGLKIHAVYNATHWPIVDTAECIASRLGVHTPPVILVQKVWKHFFSIQGPDAKFLQICHSGGADHVRNALLASPEWVRQRIIVVAIAPSVIIPNTLCYKVDSYVSKRDFVPHLDIIGKINHESQLHVLEPHPNAPYVGS
jgi:hypothetical protein